MPRARRGLGHPVDGRASSLIGGVTRSGFFNLVEEPVEQVEPAARREPPGLVFRVRLCFFEGSRGEADKRISPFRRSG